MTKQVNERTTFTGGVSHTILPDVNGGKLPISVTPSVENGTHFKAVSTAPITVTYFRNGADFQTINILGDAQTTIANNASIKTNTGAAKLLGVNKIYRFTYFSGVWYEDA